MNRETRVSDLMTPHPTALHPDATLERARRLMVQLGVRHLPVVDRGRRLVGMISQRDLASVGPELHGRVAELMAEEPLCAAPDTAAYQAAYLLLHRRIGSLPVTDGHGRLVGIVTESDFVRAAYVLLGGTVPIEQIEREEREADEV
jgi:acetoin utilization protein AcuB